MVGLEIFRLTMMCQYGIELNEEGRNHSWTIKKGSVFSCFLRFHFFLLGPLKHLGCWKFKPLLSFSSWGGPTVWSLSFSPTTNSSVGGDEINGTLPELDGSLMKSIDQALSIGVMSVEYSQRACLVCWCWQKDEDLRCRDWVKHKFEQEFTNSSRSIRGTVGITLRGQQNSQPIGWSGMWRGKKLKSKRFPSFNRSHKSCIWSLFHVTLSMLSCYIWA